MGEIDVRLKFDFSNGTPSVDFQLNVMQATPVELLVPHGRNSDKAVKAYVRAIDYLCRGVANYASGEIVGVSLEKNWFGKMEKNRDVVMWNAISDKSFVVVYDLKINSITENMYVADGIKMTKSGGSFKGVEPLWIKELLNPNKSNNELRDQAIYAISIVTEYVSGYRLVWGYGGRKGLTVLDRNDKVVVVEDIKDDETFILVKLLTLLINKGLHLGVFLIDCKGFSDSVINGFVETARLFFGDTFLFLYNLNPNSKVERVTVNLPNFLANS